MSEPIMTPSRWADRVLEEKARAETAEARVAELEQEIRDRNAADEFASREVVPRHIYDVICDHCNKVEGQRKMLADEVKRLKSVLDAVEDPCGRCVDMAMLVTTYRDAARKLWSALSATRNAGGPAVVEQAEAALHSTSWINTEDRPICQHYYGQEGGFCYSADDVIGGRCRTHR